MADKKKGYETETPLERALREAAERVSAEAGRKVRSERPTLTGIPVVKPPAKPPSPESTLHGMPAMKLPLKTSHGKYVPPEPLSPEEQRVIRERLANPELAASFLEPKNVGVARLLLEKIGEEAQHVRELEAHGFPRGVPEPRLFVPAFGSIRGKQDFLSRLNTLKQLVLTMRAFLRRFGEPTNAFKALPESKRQEILVDVLHALQEHDELRRSLGERGFSEELVIPRSLSDVLGVKPTPLANHFPEFDRHLQTLRQMSKLGDKELRSYARYAEKIAGKKGSL